MNDKLKCVIVLEGDIGVVQSYIVSMRGLIQALENVRYEDGRLSLDNWYIDTEVVEYAEPS